MSGFLIFLCVLAGIILFFIGVLSIPVKLDIGYEQYVILKVQWLFVKLDIFPWVDKPKKEKKPKKQKPKKESAKKPEKPAAPKQKKPSPIMDMLRNNGHDGMMEILQNLGRYLGKMSRGMLRAFRFTDITIHVITAKGDAASTAIEYGKDCQKVYPLIGFLCANSMVKTYDVWVQPDFLANSSQGEFFADVSICPRKFINAFIAFIFRFIIGVVVKFFLNGKGEKGHKSSDKRSQQSKTNDAPEQKVLIQERTETP